MGPHLPISDRGEPRLSARLLNLNRDRVAPER